MELKTRKRNKMRKTFAHHTPTQEAIEKIQQVRNQFSELLDLIEDLVPYNRERSIAATKLEEAAMWAIKGLVFGDPMSEAEFTADKE